METEAEAETIESTVENKSPLEKIDTNESQIPIPPEILEPEAKNSQSQKTLDISDATESNVQNQTPLENICTNEICCSFCNQIPKKGKVLDITKVEDLKLLVEALQKNSPNEKPIGPICQMCLMKLYWVLERNKVEKRDKLKMAIAAMIKESKGVQPPSRTPSTDNDGEDSKAGESKVKNINKAEKKEETKSNLKN